MFGTIAVFPQYESCSLNTFRNPLSPPVGILFMVRMPKETQSMIASFSCLPAWPCFLPCPLHPSLPSLPGFVSCIASLPCYFHLHPLPPSITSIRCRLPPLPPSFASLPSCPLRLYFHIHLNLHGTRAKACAPLVSH